MKTCIKCKIEKELTEFQFVKNTNKYINTCKKCKKEYDREYYKNNKDKIREYNKNNKDKIRESKKKWVEKNRERHKNNYKKYYKNNKDKIREWSRKYYEENKEKIKNKTREYREKNKDKIIEYNKEWGEKNREYTNEYRKNRRRTNPLFKMSLNLRTRTRSAFKRKSWRKCGSTEKLLGCSFETAHKHLEREFTKGMTWDNYGEWHIDHIIPLASAKTEEELIKLCHYRNLQPLWAKDNLSKGDNIPNTQIQLKI